MNWKIKKNYKVFGRVENEFNSGKLLLKINCNCNRGTRKKYYTKINISDVTVNVNSRDVLETCFLCDPNFQIQKKTNKRVNNKIQMKKTWSKEYN